MNLVNDKVRQYLENLTFQVTEGQVDPISAYIEVYTLNKLFEEARKEIVDHAIEKRSEIGDSEWMQNGYKVSVVSSKRYNFKGDPEVERLEALLKSRQELMKKSRSLHENGNVFFDNNGEIVPPATVNTSVSLKLEPVK